jgi:antitoxin ParD1/3/4
MSEGINVRLPGKLQAFVKEKCHPRQGFFSSSSEYIRDLIRRDYENDERRKWEGLKHELASGMTAEESEFLDLGAEALIAEAKKRKEEAAVSADDA